MSYLKGVKDSLKYIDELCDDALKEADDYQFYIKQIKSMVKTAVSDFESLIYELELGEDKLIEAARIIEKYLHSKD